jgi:outer membrane receptor protein involved in Fe transport
MAMPIKEIDATCVHELLRRIPGVIIQDDKVIIRSATSIYGKPYAAIAIDGVIIDSFKEENDFDKFSDFDLDQINMVDIERVDVFKTGNSIIWGARGGKGVISFTTKKGTFDPSQVDKIKFNTKTKTEMFLLIFILQTIRPIFR